jgi:hypothetical protein
VTFLVPVASDHRIPVFKIDILPQRITQLGRAGANA